MRLNITRSILHNLNRGVDVSLSLHDHVGEVRNFRKKLTPNLLLTRRFAYYRNIKDRRRIRASKEHCTRTASSETLKYTVQIKPKVKEKQKQPYAF